MKHHFDTKIAKQIGSIPAIILHVIQEQVKHSIKKSINIVEDGILIDDSNFPSKFSYLSIDEIEKGIRDLVSFNFIKIINQPFAASSLEKVRATNACAYYTYVPPMQRIRAGVLISQIVFLNLSRSLREDSGSCCETSRSASLAEYLYSLILERNPNFKKPNLEVWAIIIERMIRLDKRDPAEIEKVMKLCQEDSFWQNNILSAKKFRIQYDQLYMKLVKVEKPAILIAETNEKLSDHLADWYCKTWSFPNAITRKDEKFNNFIAAANKINQLAQKTGIKLQNMVKYYKQCISNEADTNGNIIYPGTLCSNSIFNFVFVQYLKKVLPSVAGVLQGAVPISNSISTVRIKPSLSGRTETISSNEQ